MAEMFFIVGRGRSGTTLISTYLNGMPGVVVAPESLFILNLKRSYEAKALTPDVLRRFCRDVFLEKRMRNWAFSAQELHQFILERHDTRPFARYAEVCRGVYEAQAYFTGTPSPTFVGDKNPHYSLFIPTLAELYPTAPFVHVIRDPRANVVSYSKVKFDYSEPRILAGRWNIYNETILRNMRMLGTRYLQVRFEDFVSDPGHTLAAIASLIGHQQDKSLAVDPIVATHIAQKPWHPRLAQRLDGRVIDEWRELLPADDARLIERECINLMRRFGYAADDPAPARPRSMWRAQLSVLCERVLFVLPLRVRSTIMTVYRKLTGTL